MNGGMIRCEGTAPHLLLALKIISNSIEATACQPGNIKVKRWRKFLYRRVEISRWKKHWKNWNVYAEPKSKAFALIKNN